MQRNSLLRAEREFSIIKLQLLVKKYPEVSLSSRNILGSKLKIGYVVGIDVPLQIKQDSTIICTNSGVVADCPKDLQK